MPSCVPVLEIGCQLATVLIALIGMIGTALGGYGLHAVTIGGTTK